jgi:hypothetical protein
MARVAEEVKIFGAVFGYAPVIAPVITIMVILYIKL